MTHDGMEGGVNGTTAHAECCQMTCDDASGPFLLRLLSVAPTWQLPLRVTSAYVLDSACQLWVTSDEAGILDFSLDYYW